MTYIHQQKTDLRRQGLVGFRKVYGEEDTAGAEAYICSDYMSSEHDDIGDATQEEWDAAKEAAGCAGRNAWEVRAVKWRAQQVSSQLHRRTLLTCICPQLNRFYSALTYFALRQNSEQLASGRHLASGGTSLPKKAVGGGSLRTARFRGVQVNAKNGPPPEGKDGQKKPYKNCVSVAWAQRMNYDINSLPDDPPTCRLFSIKISDDHLHEEDKGWLADAEDDTV